MSSNWTALVLNADFRPVSQHPLSIWPFERTMKKVLAGRVSVLETYDVELRSQNLTYRPASVIALKTYVKLPQNVPLTRLNVFLRDNFTCQYCGGTFSSQDLTFDHVKPRKDGGRNSWDNLVSACVPCNSMKGHRTDIKPRRMPKAPDPSDMLRRRKARDDNFHHSWMDYLYWSGALLQD